MHNNHAIAALPPLPLQALLPDSTLAGGTRMLLPKGGGLLPTGSRVTSLYYIAEGLLRTFRTSPGGERKILHLLGRGYFIYESYFFSKNPLRLECETLQPLSLVRFEREKALDLMKHDAFFSSRLMFSVAAKMQTMGADLVNLAYTTPLSRLKICLASMAGAPDSAGRCLLGISQAELAEIVGVHRVSINRLLQQLRERNLLELRRNGVLLHPDFFLEPELLHWDK